MYKITECRLLGKSDEEMVNEILAPYIVERQEQSTVSLCAPRPGCITQLVL